MFALWEKVKDRRSTKDRLWQGLFGEDSEKKNKEVVLVNIMCYHYRKVEDMEDKFATELLHEVKLSAKRWFIAFLVILGLWFATIGAFIWYISLPVEVTDTQVEQQSDNNSNNYVVGGDYNGSETERKENSDEESNEVEE